MHAAHSLRIESRQPKYLWFLLLSFSMTIAISNWYDARLVSIFGMTISPGTFTFPLSFLIADSITEVYGYKNARLAIWAAFLFNILFLVFGQVIIHLPSPSFATDNNAFDKLLSINTRVIFASLISYLISEPINSYIIAKIKISLDGKYMGIRFLASTIIASALDTSAFIFIAYFNIISFNQLASTILNVWIIKVLVETTLIPFSTRIASWLKKTEMMDIYDKNTDFNIFNLDSKYENDNNQFNMQSNKL